MNNKISKKLIYYGGSFISLAIVVGIFILMQKGPALIHDVQIDEVNEKDQVWGKETAKVTLIEYSDFECPACKIYHDAINELKQHFGDQIRVVYRHFPLPQHKQASLAAYVSEAAGKQGQFWAMHDLIFERQVVWSGEEEAIQIFTDYAKTLDLDIDKFLKDIKSMEIKSKVASDFESAKNAGLNGTPTLFVNGVQIQNPRNYTEFQSIIQNSM